MLASAVLVSQTLGLLLEHWRLPGSIPPMWYSMEILDGKGRSSIFSLPDSHGSFITFFWQAMSQKILFLTFFFSILAE